MINLLMALTAAGVQAATPAAPATPARALSSIPGVTVKYYDLTGKNGKEVEAALKTLRPAGADGKPVPATSSWKADAQISKRTEGTVCTVTAAKVTFSGAVELPRLVTTPLEPSFAPQWQAYSKELEADAAADLGYVHDNIGEIERAILGKSCDTAGAAMEAATAGLRARVAAIAAQRTAARVEAMKAQAKAKTQRKRLF